MRSMEAAIEVKATTRAHAGHATALRALFLERLWAGDLV
jgi:hypothetical protein